MAAVVRHTGPPPATPATTGTLDRTLAMDGTRAIDFVNDAHATQQLTRTLMNTHSPATLSPSLSNTHTHKTTTTTPTTTTTTTTTKPHTRETHDDTTYDQLPIPKSATTC